MYSDAYAKLLQEYKDKAAQAQQLAPSQQDLENVRSNQAAGDLVSNLFKASALAGSVNGKASQNPDVNYTSSANLAAQQLKDRTAQSNTAQQLALQNLNLGRQNVTDDMNADKFTMEAKNNSLNQKLKNQELAQGTYKLDNMKQSNEYSPEIGRVRMQELSLQKRLADSQGDAQTSQAISNEVSNLVKADTLYNAAQQMRQTNPSKADQLSKQANDIINPNKAANLQALERPVNEMLQNMNTKTSPEQKFKSELGQKIAGDAVKQDVVVQSLQGQIDEARNLLQKGDKDGAMQTAKRMLKTINSPMGADAIGAEESKRLGNQLEFFNLNRAMNGGKLIGVDLDGFLNAADSSLKATTTGRDNLLNKAQNLTGYNLNQVKDSNSAGSKTVNNEDAQALQWAKANPTDPRSRKILMKLSGRQNAGL